MTNPLSKKPVNDGISTITPDVRLADPAERQDPTVFFKSDELNSALKYDRSREEQSQSVAAEALLSRYNLDEKSSGHTDDDDFSHD